MNRTVFFWRAISIPFFSVFCFGMGQAYADNPLVNTHIFKPSAHVGDLINTQSNRQSGHGTWGLGLVLDYGKKPLVFLDGKERHGVIEDQLAASVFGSVTLWDRLSVGLSLPLFLMNEGKAQGFIPLEESPHGFALGDLYLSLKGAILARHDGKDGFGLGVGLDFGFPTGDRNAFVSDGFSILPSLILDYQVENFLVALNLGSHFRTEDADLYGYTDVTDAFFWKVGAEYRFDTFPLALIGELYGFIPYGAQPSNGTSMEGILAASVPLGETGLSALAGGGAGFMDGYGNTQFRFFAGLKFSSLGRDAETAEEEEVLIVEEFKHCATPAPDGFDGDYDEYGCAIVVEEKVKVPEVEMVKPKVLEPAPAPAPVIKKPVRLAQIKGDKIEITEKIYFDSGLATIKPLSFRVLNDVREVLDENPKIEHLVIEGHTDDVGRVQMNVRLSQQRAEAVRDWLIVNGIDGKRLEAKGYGPNKPAVKGQSEEAREANRRVEFTIVK